MAKSSTSGQGRPKGATNKATADARAAIALFVNNNADRLEGWLDQVAQENPAEAFKLFQSVIEYHVPKLARTEVEATVQHSYEDALLNIMNENGSSSAD